MKIGEHDGSKTIHHPLYISLKARGASFDWEVAGKGAKGYCNVDGQGKITEFEQW